MLIRHIKSIVSKNEAHNMKLIHRFLENTPLWFINFISIVSFIVTIVTAIGGIIGFFLQKNDNTPLDINQWQSLIIVLLILFIVMLVGQIWRNYKRSYTRIQCIAKSFHILAHRFRDEMLQIHRDYENNDLTSAFLFRHLFDFLEQSLNALCNIMSDFTGEKICACIQMIKFSSDGQPDNDEVFVLCHSENSDERRKNQDVGTRTRILREDPILSQMVGLNAVSFFSCPNLQEYAKNHSNDKNFTVNFRNSPISLYNGVFIVPIRINNSTRCGDQKDAPFHIVGFLCLDTRSTKAFLSKYENDYAQIMKTFSDIFYVAIEIYNDFESRILQRENQEEICKKTKKIR